jgi:uncharacterized protein (TIGR02271 family)
VSDSSIEQYVGKTLYAQDDEKIGRIGQVYLDDTSSRPEFVTVNTGLFGLNESFVPVEAITVTGDRAVVSFSKDKVKDAPNVDLQGPHLDESQEQELYGYYGLDYGSGHDAGADHTTGTAGMTGVVGEGHDTSGANTDDAMTRSEERLDVGTTRQERGRARLRKYVTTEQETVTVPVRKERAVVETEPITDANIDAATDGPTISEEEHEVVLSEERPVVSKTAEPVERVRLGTETVTEEETVSEDVRKEHIDVEGDVDQRR